MKNLLQYKNGTILNKKYATKLSIKRLKHEKSNNKGARF